MSVFNSQNPNAVQGVGASHSKQGIRVNDLTLENVAAEVALSAIGNFEPLDYKLDYHGIQNVIREKYQDDWVDYLPRTDRANNRKAMSLTTMPGWNHKSPPSIPEAIKYFGRDVKEFEFSAPTDLYNDCDNAHPGNLSLKSFLDDWQPLGRTFIVNAGIGGYFVPHRDHPGMPRPALRLIAFLDNCGPMDYDWLMDNRKVDIELGRVYYVNTRMTHRTMSWVNNSLHLILNIPFNSRNVSKVLENLQHRH